MNITIPYAVADFADLRERGFYLSLWKMLKKLLDALVMTGIPGTDFHNDCHIIKFKYFKSKEVTEVKK